jgi:RHS repeat-associated protein
LGLISGGIFQGYGPERGFDNDLSTGFSAPSNPSVNYVGQDFGAGNARNIEILRIYGSPHSYGLKATLQYSDDGATWSDTNLTNINVPQGSGWHTFTVEDYGAHRYWRLVEVSGYAYFQAGEIEMYERGTVWGSISGGTFQAGYGPKRGFDDNPSYGFSAPSNPSVNYVGQYFGAGNARNIGLIKIYGSSYSFGLRAKFQYSDDGVSWSDTNLTNINVPQGSGWHTFTVGDYGAHRYWRLVEVSGYAGFQAGEVEMFDRNTIWGLISGGTFQTGYGPERGFDDNLSTGFSVPSNPSVNYVGQDFGSGNARNIGLIKIYGSPYSYGLRAKFQYSDDGVSWSDTNLTNINVLQGSGWHTFPVEDYGAHRYWRLVEVSGYAYFQAGEVEMFERGECAPLSASSFAPLSAGARTMASGASIQEAGGTTESLDNLVTFDEHHLFINVAASPGLNYGLGDFTVVVRTSFPSSEGLGVSSSPLEEDQTSAKSPLEEPVLSEVEGDQGGVPHIAAGVRQGDNLSLYLDGELQAQETIGSKRVKTLTVNIGLEDATEAIIEDVQLYDYALFPEDIAAIPLLEGAGVGSPGSAGVSPAPEADGTSATIPLPEGPVLSLSKGVRDGSLPASVSNNSPTFGLLGSGPVVTTTITYYYINGQRVTQAKDGVFTWIHADHLSSATRLTDAAGLEIRRVAYKSFGEEAENQGSGDDPKYTYTGKEHDATGLYYFGARYYDPVLSRFITADTLYDAGPQGLNRYSYALNNPILYRDPTGHQVEHWYHPFTNAVRGAHETVNAGLAWVDEASGHNTVVVVVNNAVVKTVSDVGFGIVESGAGLIPLGEEIGEWVVDPLDPNKIPVVGRIGKEVGESYADVYMDPNVETVSRAVAATADAVGTALSGVQTARGLTKPSQSKTSKKRPGSRGHPDHQTKVDKLEQKALDEVESGEQVLREKKIRGHDSKRIPDVQIVDDEGKARKVFEAERHPNRKRNLKREAEYEELGVEYETHELDE